MLKNFITVAVRALLANKVISVIHILGLAIGISASLMVFLIVRFEYSFNGFSSESDRVYRVVMDFKFGDVSGHSGAVPAPLANAVANEVTGIEATAPVLQFQGDASAKVEVNRTQAEPIIFKKQANIIFTTPDYFDIVPYEWIAGEAQSSLNEPFSVVLTESRARQYFPGLEYNSVRGKEIKYNDEVSALVTGVVKDLDVPSDLSYSEFISYSTIAKTNLRQNFMMDVWNDWMAYSTLFIKLSPAIDHASVSGQLNLILRKFNTVKGNSDMTMQLALQPLHDVHFNHDYVSFNQRVANRQTLSGLVLIAAFLLLLACINFTNISTAQATRRAKEIGIRKTIGSSRMNLIIQLLGETFFITLLSAIVSASLTPLLLELFSDFLPPGISFPGVDDPFVFVFLISLTCVVTILSGTYPALILSKFRPIQVLKNQMAGATTRSGGIRKILTVSQFVVAQFFIITAFMVTKQVHFSLNQELGYRKDAIITFPMPRDTVADHREKIRNEIRTMPEVQQVSIGFLPPAMEGAAFGNISYKKESGEEVKINVQVRWGDPEYIELYSIKIIAGRNINAGENIAESLINQSYAKQLGFTSEGDALGKELTMGDGSKSTIVGVMRDFHEGSTHSHIGPIVFRSRNDGNFFHIALGPMNAEGATWQHAISKIEKVFHSVYPGEEFNYNFFDDTIARFYTEEQKMSRLLNWAMVLSILISCLGLLGLVMYTVQMRTKEIGMRKILGASVSNIISLFSLQFLQLVTIAFTIAAPVAWWTTDQWLQTFAYRTDMSWWVFAVSGLFLLAIATITISSLVIKTATENPVKNLRAE